MDEQPPICDDGERAVLLSGKWVKLKAELDRKSTRLNSSH